ncbi:DNA-3-methyladenine glycosylase [Halobaculum sp. MBLA0143]|uniref:DNA-3-methyladenine glycosylase family protein n=1 Tax=Halobaculum sp. MBLA0143 TaxID=3079933 RepID=UPI0035245025
METGVVPLSTVDGPFDLQATVESGQTYLWDRADDGMYETPVAHGGDHWYETVVRPFRPPGDPDADPLVPEPAVVRVRQVGDADDPDARLEWESNVDAERLLTHLLRLDDDLDEILGATPDVDLLADAYDAFRGMRLVRDPPFACLISFICSAQMRVSRIHGMQIRMAEAFGDPVEFDGETYHAFPTPEQLAARTEAELRDLSLGYRAPYVQRTAELVADGEATPAAAADLEYEAAREYLTQFVGVGDKVADCVLLFSLSFLEAVPLDTWIQTAIGDYFPDCDRGNYADTSRAIREQFGGEFAGYAQTYVFYYLRTQGE